jgi:protein ImuB
MACVNVAELPLQILLRENPEWHTHPVAVLDRDKPQGRILWVNRHARKYRILPGMTYAAALSLCDSLYARDVPAPDIERAVEILARHLRRSTPAVESESFGSESSGGSGEPGVFWLNASGLDRLYKSLTQWAESIRATIARLEQFECAIVVGFTKFSTYAVSRKTVAPGRAGNNRPPAVHVFESPQAEEHAARRVPLEYLSLPPSTRDTLARLDVHTLGDFADLPPDGMKRRFGKKTARLHSLARGEIQLPLAPRLFEQAPRQEIHLDYAESDVSRLIMIIGRLLGEALKVLSERHEALAELCLVLHFEDGPPREERLRPAAPTLELVQLIDLIHLRLEKTDEQQFKKPFEKRRSSKNSVSGQQLSGGVTDIVLSARGEHLKSEQLELFAENPPRDLAAAQRALARIRAEFGDNAVVHAKPGEGHLPNALFTWERLDQLPEARPREVPTPSLVRRIFTRPILLPARPRHEPDGWMLRGLEQGPVVRVLGPYIISGGWWRRRIHREYHFAETQHGEILWAYYDRYRRRWFLQGRVE